MTACSKILLKQDGSVYSLGGCAISGTNQFPHRIKIDVCQLSKSLKAIFMLSSHNSIKRLLKKKTFSAECII